MKYLLYALLLLVTACASDEEILKPTLEYPNDFAIVDDPNDSVQHERYLLYKEYGVAVYLNDTIVRKQKGVDWQGKPVYVYETIDLNWSFTDYSRGVAYDYAYLTDPAEQMQALRYARRYLEQVSKPMRPFSIMLADTLTVTSNSKVERPLYHVGARTLVFAQMKDVVNASEMDEQFFNVIRSMVSDRVKANREVCARFALSATENAWYGKMWKDLNCPNITEWLKTSWVINPNVLYNEPPYTPYNGEDLVAVLTNINLNGTSYVASYEEAVAVRQKFIADMGQYGFIRGWKEGGAYVPANDTEDREQYIQAILTLGEWGFRARYGNASLVMEKYEILATFITQTLGVDLDFDGRLTE